MWRISCVRPFVSSRHISYLLLLYTNTLTHTKVLVRCELVVWLSRSVCRLYICACLSVQYILTSPPHVYTNLSYNLLSFLTRWSFEYFVLKLVKNVWQREQRGKKYSFRNLFIYYKFISFEQNSENMCRITKNKH